jgi:hypothetical protein
VFDAPNEEIISIVRNDPNFIPALFTDEVPVDLPRVRVISALWRCGRELISSAVCRSPTFMVCLIRAIPGGSETSVLGIVNDLVRADGKLLVRLGPRLGDCVQGRIRDFPVCLVAKFLAAAPGLRSELRDGLDDWLLEHGDFTIGDVRRFLESFPGLWNRKVAIHFVLHAELTHEGGDLQWLHKLPLQDFEVESSDVGLLVARFVQPPVSFSSVCRGFGSQKHIVNPGAELAVLLLRILVRVDPVRMATELVDAVSQLLNK